MHFDHRTVAADRIDRREETFRVTTSRPFADLAASIRDMGLIRPPILRETGDGYRVISGFRRLEAADALGLPRVPALVVDPEALPLECLKIAIADNAFERPLNLIEQSRALAKLAEYLPAEDRLAEAAGKLGLPDDKPFLKKIRPLCRLPQAVQQGVTGGRISLAMALELGRLEAGEAASFATLFEQLNLSLGKQREVLVLVTEIAGREGISPSAVLGGEPVAGVLQNPDLDSGRKARELRACLKRLRFPALGRTEAAFREYTRRLQLGHGVQLIPPADFEGSAYSLKIDFTGPADLDAKRQVLDTIVQTPFFDKIAPQGFEFT